MKCFACSLCLILIVCFSLDGTLLAGDTEVFLQNYPAALRKLESRLSQIEGDATLTVYNTTGAKAAAQTSPNQIISKSELKFYRDHGFTKYEEVMTDKKRSSRREEVLCVGPTEGFYPSTAFRLAKTAGKKEYELRGIDNKFREFGTYTDKIARFVDASYSVKGIPMSYIMTQDKTFRLTSVSTINETGKTYYKVEFSRGADAKTSNQTEVIIDPELDWSIIRGEHRFGNIRTIFSNEYSSTGGNSTAKRVTYVEPAVHKISVFDLDSLSLQKSPIRIFSMKYYGIPDVLSPGEINDSGNLGFYLVIGAVFSFGGAMYMVVNNSIKHRNRKRV